MALRACLRRERIRCYALGLWLLRIALTSKDPMLQDRALAPGKHTTQFESLDSRLAAFGNQANAD